MDLSIIVPIYQTNLDEQLIDKMITNFMGQTDLNSALEVILSFHHSNEITMIKVENKLSQVKNLSEKIRVTNFTSHKNRRSAIEAGHRVAIGKFCLVLPLEVKFNKRLFSHLVECLKMHYEADIIEFGATLESPIKLDLPIRLEQKEIVEIRQKREVVAYSNFFDFTKLIQRTLFQKIINFMTTFELESDFSVEIVFKAFLLGKTYANYPKLLLSYENATNDETFVPFKQVEQWQKTLSILKQNFNNYLVEEITYNMIITFANIYEANVRRFKSHKILDAYASTMKHAISKLDFSDNHYYNTIQKEAKKAKLIIDKI